MEWTAILLLVLSITLIFLETMIPSMGLLSLMALACGAFALVIAFQVSETFGITLIFVVLVVGPLCAAAGVKVLPRTPWGKRMMVRGTSFTAEEGRGTDRGLQGLVGQVGIAESMLRPSGTVRIDERRISCFTRGELIEPGSPVRILRVEGNGLLVEAAEERDSA
ncbi:MAG: hypothetical protein H6834_11870 [Planctomycetes bacterium]|nr:hypothetical protein [Planctomycetota bacterium]